jgi:hypothetical protein
VPLSGLVPPPLAEESGPPPPAPASTPPSGAGGTHAPLKQMRPRAHSVLSTQLVPQTPPVEAHAKGLQVAAPGVTHTAFAQAGAAAA